MTEQTTTEAEGRPEPPSNEELARAAAEAASRPDPRQAAYDAVYAYIRELGNYLPADPVLRNAIIWRAVHAALDATPVGRCISSHCVEGDHILDPDQPAAGPSVAEAAADDRRWPLEKHGER
ncbi:hypothetical protein ABZX95_17385 [Streptomyces sp. NPDC004232]|uniref:hypothetical protein n=1 Tax=Streptomyces sp. NPDC004232 TaxID=3154454 RepID=UPI0033A047CF